MLAVIGFHRSLTSVVSQWLHNSGVCMGEYLMPPAPSNPEGHYEDMALVALHDDLLRLQGTSWQFAGEVSLSADAGQEVLHRYVALRDRLHGSHWGMKDPRQCLFLPNWQRAVGERGRYLVILRHWSASIQSLLKRSAQDMALGVGSASADGAFWRDYGHAARNWLAYNEILLDFLERCPQNQRLVVTQQALIQGLELPRLVEQKFAIPLRADTPSPIKVGLVHDKVARSVCTHLSDEHIERMEALWARLLAFAEYRAEHESPRWVADSSPGRDRWLARSILSVSPYKPESAAPAGKVSLDDSPVADSSFSSLSARAEREYRMLALPEAEQHTREAMALRPNEVSCYVRLACILLVSGQLEAAEEVLSSAIERLGEVAILLHYRATVLDLLDRTSEAIALLDSAYCSSDLLDRDRIAYMLKSGQPGGRRGFEVWSRKRSNSYQAWQMVSAALTRVEYPALREDLALRVASIWSQ